MPRLYLHLRTGEHFQIGDALVTLERCSRPPRKLRADGERGPRWQARLLIEAPASVPINDPRTCTGTLILGLLALGE